MDSSLKCSRRSFDDLILNFPPDVNNVSDITEYYVFSPALVFTFILIILLSGYIIWQAGKKIRKEQIKSQHTRQALNLMFLGETGVGKSTLINAFINYLKHPKFNSARKCKMEYVIPYNLNVQKSDAPLDDIWITCFEDDDNRNNIMHENENFNKRGESVTQKPQEHMVSFENCYIRIIDTPGLKDTRGRDQDIRNLNYIKDFIKDIDRIDAICLVMHSNQTKLTKEFETSMHNLLSLFSSKPMDNVYFFFTYANVTLFNIGDTMTAILQFCKKYNFVIPLNPDHFYVVDNESYRYLLARQHNVDYSSTSEDTLKKIWEKSSDEIHRFFEFLKISI